jgi:hypothetical protein
MVGKLGYVSFLTFITISALAPAAAGESDHVTTITIEGPSRPKPSAQAACTEITTAPQLNRIRTDLAGDYCLAANLLQGGASLRAARRGMRKSTIVHPPPAPICASRSWDGLTVQDAARPGGSPEGLEAFDSRMPRR